MTLTERVKELDRLYLAHDAIFRAYVVAIGSPAEKRMRRKVNRAWAKYAALRDSRRGRRGQ
jgi:hypothetical protein